MKNFILEYSITIIKAVEIMAAVTGILVLKRYKGTPNKFFIFFLVGIVLLENIGAYVRYVRPGKFLHFLQHTLIEKNYWLFTLFWEIGAIVFFTYYYSKILNHTLFKKALHYIGIAYLGFSIIFIIFNWKAFFNKFFPTLNILGALIVFICCAFYFIELMQSERILYFYKILSFYITVVIFIWWLVITPLTFYDLFYDKFDLSKPFRHPEFFGDINYVLLRRRIYLFSNIFMYSTYTFALLWCKPEND